MWFDKLTTNGINKLPFVLSLSKDLIGVSPGHVELPWSVDAWSTDQKMHQEGIFGQKSASSAAHHLAAPSAANYHVENATRRIRDTRATKRNRISA